jgi:hypothetical protein
VTERSVQKKNDEDVQFEYHDEREFQVGEVKEEKQRMEEEQELIYRGISHDHVRHSLNAGHITPLCKSV